MQWDATAPDLVQRAGSIGVFAPVSLVHAHPALPREGRMASDLNRVLLSGRLGADPERRRTRRPCAVFRVAANHLECGVEHTEWFRIVTWDALAEGCLEALRRGAPVMVLGRLQTRIWVDQATRQERSVVEVVASFVLDARGGRSWSDGDVSEPEWEAAAAALAAMNADLDAALDAPPTPPALPEPSGEWTPQWEAGPPVRDPAAIRRCRAARRAFFERWGHLVRPRRFSEIRRFLPGVDEPTTAEGWNLLAEQMAAAVAARVPAFSVEDLPAYLAGVSAAA